MGGVATVPGRGRKPKPTARKIAAGNPGKRALNKDEPDFGAVQNIDPPEWIQAEARDMWERIVPPLCAQKILQITDLHIVEKFCASYRNWRVAQADLDANGPVVMSAQGSPIKNPAATVVNEAAAKMASYGALLGLDPASRQRLVGAKPKTPDNPFAKLIGK